jgi:hypothetical protein
MVIQAEKGATFGASANGLTIFEHAGSFLSSFGINGLAFSGGGYTGVTAIDLNIVGQDSFLENVYITSCEYGIVTENVIGLRITNPTMRKVRYGIVFNNSSNGILLSAPNFDNATSVGGTGDGYGIYVTAAAYVKLIGGFIQGYDYGVRVDSGGINIESVYFESCTDAAVYLFNAGGVTVEDCYFFGFSGNCMIKGRSASNNYLLNNQMNKSTATGGLYDFDANCTNNFEQTLVRSSGINTDLGIRKGLSPVSMVTGGYKFTTSENGSAAANTAFNTFVGSVEDFSVTRFEVFIEAIERTGYVASAVKKFIFTVHQDGSTATVSSITDVSDYSISKSNANYSITPSISVPIVTANSIIVQTTLTSGGIIGFTQAYYRARIVAETTSNFVGVSES